VTEGAPSGGPASPDQQAAGPVDSDEALQSVGHQ
jgi:hypothetical protein